MTMRMGGGDGRFLSHTHSTALLGNVRDGHGVAFFHCSYVRSKIRYVLRVLRVVYFIGIDFSFVRSTLWCARYGTIARLF